MADFGEVERLRRELQLLSKEAFLAIQDARQELDDIEIEVKNAVCDRPYTNIGQIDGISAEAIFSVWIIRDRLDYARGAQSADASNA
jgi:hypothetical protein